MKIFIICAMVFALAGCTTVTSGWGNAHYSVAASAAQYESNVYGLALSSSSARAGAIDVGRIANGDSFVSNFNESSASEKTGEAGSVFLFGLIALTNGGDITVAKAMENGGIRKLNTVETKTTYYPFVFRRTTIVTGE